MSIEPRTSPGGEPPRAPATPRRAIRRLAFVAALAAGSLVVVPQSSSHAQVAANPSPAAPRTLYVRLGGIDAIKAIVHEFLNNVAADPKINKRFARTKLSELEARLVEQVCAVTGGPCRYTGKAMPDAHAGMRIDLDEFNAMVGDLKKALDRFKMGSAEQTDLLAQLVGMKSDIVNK